MGCLNKQDENILARLKFIQSTDQSKTKCNLTRIIVEKVVGNSIAAELLFSSVLFFSLTLSFSAVFTFSSPSILHLFPNVFDGFHLRIRCQGNKMPQVWQPQCVLAAPSPLTPALIATTSPQTLPWSCPLLPHLMVPDSLALDPLLLPHLLLWGKILLAWI